MQALYKAEYDYAAQTDDELTIREDQLLFLLENSTDDWVKVRIKTDNPGAEVPQEGLVPATYVVPATALGQVTAAYDYDADPQEPEELTMRENESLDLFEKGEDWTLVGRDNAVGFVPTAYLDDMQPTQSQAADEEQEQAPSASPAAAAAPAFLPPPTRQAPPSASAVETFNVTLVNSGGLMKSKKKGTLGIGNGALFFASESDKTPVQQVSLNDLTSFDKPDKYKLNVVFSGGEEFHFEIKSKDDATKVHDLLAQASGQSASPSGGVAAEQEEDEAEQEPAPSRSALPPPPRALRMATSSDEEDEDDEDDARAAPPPPTAPPAPPAPAAPPAPPAPVAPPAPTAPTSSSSAPAAAGQQKQGTMAYDFEATDPDEITVAEGDEVVILDDSSEDWWMVRRVASGQEGNVPAQYVEVGQATSAQPPPAPAAPPAPTGPMGIMPPPQRSRALSQPAEPEPEESEDPEEAAKQQQIDADAQKAQRLHDAEQRRIMKEAEARDMRTAKGIHFADEPPRMPAPKPIPVPADPHDLNNPPPAVAPAESDRRTPSVPEVSKTERKKPNMQKTRVWKDLTGNFKVEAEFLGVSNGKVRLHKVNGVVIDVPLQKMSAMDAQLIKNLTRRDANDDDVPLATSSRSTPDKERERKEKERRHRAHVAAQQQHQQRKKPTVDWFEFFLNAGCDLDDCTRYAHNFERDRIDEEVLPELEAPTMRNLGLREGDLIRVRKHIKSKYGRSAAMPAEESRDKVQDGDKEGPGLFTGPSGGLKSTRRGRPTPSTSRSGTTDSVNADGLKGASEELSRVGSPSTSRDAVSPSPSKGSRRSSSVQPIVGSISGFDDDAWTVKAPSSKPSTPSPAPPATTGSPSPKPVSPQPQKSPNDTLADDILKRMGISENQQRPSSAAPPQRQTSSNFLSPAATPQQQQQQQQQPDPNAPRGPYAPVAQNAPMLNPLIPTQTGFNGFVPTRPQSTGMMPQSTGMPMSSMSMSMAPQATGMMSQPTGMPMSSMGMSMAPQATGMPMSMGMSMAPQPTGYIQPQQTSAAFQQPQMTAYAQPQQYQPQSQFQSPQLNVQPTGYGSQQQQQQQPGMSQGGLAPQPTGVFANPSMFQQPQPTGSTPANKFDPGNVFAAMKTGSNSLDAAPQSAGAYDALRPQMTGMPSQQQPLQPQPTGFAPTQMFVPQQPQMPMQTGMYRPY